jgi:hypothetical protein
MISWPIMSSVREVTAIKKRRWRWFLIVVILGVVLAAAYVRANPLIFNESLWNHAHCIKIAGMELELYADANGGRFPSHPRGYGNALLLLNEDCYFALTGPGYEAELFHQAKRDGRVLAENECGRVYVQGLSKRSNAGIALLFDKLPTPGGDHCHFPHRLWAPVGREVWFVGGHSTFIAERDWPQFALEQVELLTKKEFARAEAERLFASKPKQ